jgi:hypothetical protein
MDGLAQGRGKYCKVVKPAVVVLVLLLSFAAMPFGYQGKHQAEAELTDFSFVAAGNFGCSASMGEDGYGKGKEVLAKIAEHNPEVVLGLGGYSGQASVQCWHDDLDDFPVVHAAMHNTAFRPIAIGESEAKVLNATERVEFLDHFGIGEDATFYSFDHKGVHFLALDTTAEFGVGSAQYNFTAADLGSASEDVSIKWIVVFFHKPMYRSECTSCGVEGADIQFRNVYQPLFDRNRVDLVIAGHVPAYERFKPITHSAINTNQTASINQVSDHSLSSYVDPRGQIHVTVGTGGADVEPWSGLAPEVANRVGQTYGFLKVDVNNAGNTITGSFIDKDASPGFVQDSFTVTHSGRHADPEYFKLGGLPELSSRISVPSSPSLQLNQFTLAAWFQTNHDFGQPDSEQRMIVNKGGFNGDGTGQDMNYGIWINGDGKVQGGFEALSVAPSLKDMFVTSERPYNDGRWHHALLTNDGTTLRLYVDGLPASGALATMDVTSRLPDSTGNQPFKIGYNSGVTNDLARAFHGGIDEVTVWNRALSSTEVWAVYGGNVNTNGQVLFKPASRPIPNAGSDQTVTENSVVRLSALGSVDPDGTIFSYSWTQVAGPAVAISSATAPQITFTAPTVGIGGDKLTFSLAVEDNEGLPCLEHDQVEVIIADSDNQPVVANAGSDLSANEGNIVMLNGTGSFDPEGQSLTYFWVQTFGPQVTLDNPTSPRPQFHVPEFNNKNTPLVMNFLLTVNDGHQSARDTVSVSIVDGLFAATGSQYRDYEDKWLLRLSPFSLAGWVKTTMDTSDLDEKIPIINKGGFGTDAHNSNMNYGIWLDCGASEDNPDCRGGNRFEAGFETANGTDVFVASPVDVAYNNGKWHFVVVTFDGYKLRLYVNAVQVDGRTSTLQPDSGSGEPLRLGANSLYEPGGVYQPQYFVGEIDEIGVWNRALSREEIASIYVTRNMNQLGMILYDDLN